MAFAEGEVLLDRVVIGHGAFVTFRFETNFGELGVSARLGAVVEFSHIWASC